MAKHIYDESGTKTGEILSDEEHRRRNYDGPGCNSFHFGCLIFVCIIFFPVLFIIPDSWDLELLGKVFGWIFFLVVVGFFIWVFKKD